MSRLLEGRVAIVTGGSSGLGRATALRFASEGAQVVVADIRSSPRHADSEPTEAAIQANGGVACAVPCDVTKSEDIEAAVEAARRFGGVDTLVNAAGLVLASDFLTVSEEDYDRVMGVNVKGSFFAAQLVAKDMVSRGVSGSIVNFSSTAGLQGLGAGTVYCASKGAVRLMTYAMADALGPCGIRVNAIHPGIIETAMTTVDTPIIDTDLGDVLLANTPLGRFGVPADVASCALYLASDLAAYVTGTSLVVDGGRTRS